MMNLKNTFLPGLIFITAFIVNCDTDQNSGNLSGSEFIYRFDFGSVRVAKGFTCVDTSRKFNGKNSWGFPGNAEIIPVKREGKDRLTNDFITSEDAFYFLMDVPEGNFNVRIGLGDTEGRSSTTIKSESRRLMAKEIETAGGEVRSVMFTVNIRYPELTDGRRVRLKSREHGHFNWDQQLSLEFGGRRPCIDFLEVTRNDTAITLFLAGNSTVTDQRYEPYSTWGQMLPVFFKPGHIAVANHAESGEALKSFMEELRLEKIWQMIRPGDYLFIQFGHNDQKKNSSAYLDPAGGYREYLESYIEGARLRGAVPVLVTPVHRRTFGDEGNLINSHGDYPGAMRQVAEEEEVALIDLSVMSQHLYEALGPEDSKKLFVYYPAGSFPGQESDLTDDSHHSSYGAYQLARCIVAGIREQLPELAQFLVDEDTGYDPSDPDPYIEWDLSASPQVDLETPEGR